MPIINHKKKWLYLDEPHTGSRACIQALLKIPGSEYIGKQHESWPSLPINLRNFRIFSVVRHPLDIIATLATKSETVPYWLIHKYRHRDAFFTHRCQVTLFYEAGLQSVIEQEVGVSLDFNIINATQYKLNWRHMFTRKDLRFASATIPELFTLGYIDWKVKNSLKGRDITRYLKTHGDQRPHG